MMFKGVLYDLSVNASNEIESGRLLLGMIPLVLAEYDIGVVASESVVLDQDRIPRLDE